MSIQKFDDECPGCRPAMLDVKTGKRLSDDSPPMKIVLCAWGTLTLSEKQAWHRFTCQSSRTLSDVQSVEAITRRVQDALNALAKDV